MNWLLARLVRLWLGSLRVDVDFHPGVHDDPARPRIIAFLHGDLMAMIAWPRRRMTWALVSASRDGGWLAAALSRLPLVGIVRGSSSRDGAGALRALLRAALRAPSDCAFAVDGPRGPRGAMHGGVLACARALEGRVIPLTARCGAALTLRTWDRAIIPLPFSRVSLRLGAPIDAAEPRARERLLHALAPCSAEAPNSHRTEVGS